MDCLPFFMAADLDISNICWICAVWKIAPYLLALLILLATLEQFDLYKRKGNLPGPLVTIPFLGATLELVRHPVAFWHKQRKWASKSGLSWNYIGGKFMVLCTKAKYARLPFLKNSPTDFAGIVHLQTNANAVFGDECVMYMTGEKHKALRKSFINLFTRKALGLYVSVQERVIRDFVGMWLSEGQENVEMRTRLRSLNLHSSQTVFIGPYLKDPGRFSDLMLIMGEAFTSLPINLPGSGVWKAHRARKEVEQVLLSAVEQSMQVMRESTLPQCLVDVWCQSALQEICKAAKGDGPVPEHCKASAISSTLLDMLFAAQDASTSSLTHAVALMADYPAVLEKVHQEQREINPNGEHISNEMLQNMVYTRQVVKEILRFKPPVPMWGHRAQSDIQLADDFVVPKDSVVFSSIISACQEGYSEPEKFNPDRMGSELQEDAKYAKNFLVFGTGPHMCAGREYAINHMMVFLAVLATTCTWTRKRTSKSDELAFLPSAYPADCIVTLKPRVN